MCNVWCEFALAFRSLGAVAVYLANRERRAEIVGVRATFRKLCTRVSSCLSCTPSPYSPLDSSNGGEMQHASDLNNTGAAADASSCGIDVRNISKVRQLGKGGFGTVWSGILRSEREVAIKILRRQLDDDGEDVNPNTDEDFKRESEALQCVKSECLIDFFGFGKNEDGDWFLVTELMSGGSLEDVLHDHQVELPWRNRAQFALDAARGMEQLHMRYEKISTFVCMFQRVGVNRARTCSVARPLLALVRDHSLAGLTYIALFALLFLFLCTLHCTC
jgi:hypothetical protein